jgi:uncharacterized ubiquitin-like protein YukD
MYSFADDAYDGFFRIFITIYLSRYNSCYYDNRISMYAPVRVRIYTMLNTYTFILYTRTAIKIFGAIRT